MNRRSLSSLFSIFVLIGMILLPVGCSTGSKQSSSGEEATPTPIPTSIVPTNPTYTVQRGTVINEMQFTARVAPVLEEELFFKMGGYVDKVYVRRGDEVKKGDLLAELEVTDLKNQITQKEAELQSELNGRPFQGRPPQDQRQQREHRPIRDAVLADVHPGDVKEQRQREPSHWKIITMTAAR